MIEAVIFDCDGVLVDSEILAVEVETGMLAELGLHYEHQEFKTRFMGMSDAAFFAELDSDCRERLGAPLPVDFPARCRERLHREVRVRLVEVAGARKGIAALRKKKAVASSSTSDKLQMKLVHVGLWDLFAPHIYGADHVPHAKPAPDLFLHAADMLGVCPTACLVVEDSINGVRAGLAAGMRVWGFGGGGHMDDSACRRLMTAGAERVISNWNDLPPLLAAL